MQHSKPTLRLSYRLSSGQVHRVPAGAPRYARHAHGKHAAPVRRRGRPLLLARGHVQRGQVRAAERACGGPLHRQRHTSQARAGRSFVAGHRAGLAQRHPQVARPAGRIPGLEVSSAASPSSLREMPHAPSHYPATGACALPPALPAERLLRRVWNAVSEPLVSTMQLNACMSSHS